MFSTKHLPVLLQEVLEGLEVKRGGSYIDTTVGTGGHAIAILERIGATGQLLGIDFDPQMLKVAKENLANYKGRVTLTVGNFREVAEISRKHGFHNVDGILFDLGLSSLQLEWAERGFSFQQEGPLDMRFSPEQEMTAAKLINHLPEKELADLIFRYGEEPRSRAIARAIVHHRPLKTTKELAGVVARAARRRGRIHPATRTFQALRIAVNDELAALEEALPQAVDLLHPGGRLAVISFHSLEDRIVKNFFRSEERLQMITPKPLRPDRDEIQANPRARSARLRIAQRKS